jgi:phosphoribosyl 1,2-cyclic phosphodiesterase
MQSSVSTAQHADMLNLSRRHAIIKFCVLASGSAGNCAWLATERTRLLVDAGLSFKALGQRLQSVGERTETLNAVVVTHEHADHIAGLARLVRRLRIPVYISKLTAPAIAWEQPTPSIECFQAGTSFTVGDIQVDSFGIPHDARDPVGFGFRAEGIKIAVVTDLGYLTESVKFHLRRSHLMLLESNHDLEMLKVGPYPWSVKQRVMSRVGHLSNDMMGDFLLRDFDGFPVRLVLGHLSESNNHPEIVRLVATQALEQRGLETPVEIATQSRPTEVYRF